MRIVTASALALLLLGLVACTKPLKEYSYPAWGFAVSFREPPMETDTPAARDGTAHTFQARTVSNDRVLVVTVTDAAGSDKTDDQILSEVPQAAIQSSGGTVSGHADVKAGAVVGREVTIDRGAQPSERLRVFVANKKVYQVIARASDPDDKEVLAFMDSFRLLGQ
jgi:hypothetical protein